MTHCISLLMSATFFLFQANGAAQQAGGVRKEEGKPLIVEAKSKPANSWKEYPTRTIHHLPGFDVSKVDGAMDKFGGLLPAKEKATGFFRAEKKGDRWRLIDPEGCWFINKAIVSISPEQTTAVPQKALRDKFKDVAGWAEATTKLLRENGFNSAGAWTRTEDLRKASNPLAYTVILNWMSGYGKERGGTFQQPGHTGYPNDCIFAFDPGFETYCNKAAEKLKAMKDDPYLFGYFSDNEMPFKEDALNKYLSLPESDPGHQAALKFLRERKGANAGKADITKEDREKFLRHMTERYFKVVATAIKKADPNHMYLGPRFNGGVLKLRPVFEAAGPYVDVVAVNYYGAWTPDPARMKEWGEWAGKPFMVTEWYTKGEDSGMANSTGAGWIVKTQKDRGMFYQNYVLGLLAAKDCVGWQWFKYQDNDPNNLKTDPSNRDSNKGIVNVEFKPYAPLLEQMKEINERAYGLTEYFDMSH